MRKLIAAAALLLLALDPAAEAGGPQAFCGRVGTDDALRPLVPSLLGAARQAFGYTGVPALQIERMTVFRCMDKAVLICSWGANLPCGKADTATSMPAATQYCAANPDADFIPAYVTGHETIYQWSCHGGIAVPSQPAPLDARGFFQSYWVKLPQK